MLKKLWSNIVLMSLLFYSYIFSIWFIFIAVLYSLKFTERLHVREHARLFGKFYFREYAEILNNKISFDYFIKQTLTILDLLTGFLEGTFGIEPIVKFTKIIDNYSQTIDEQNDCVIVDQNIVNNIDNNIDNTAVCNENIDMMNINNNNIVICNNNINNIENDKKDEKGNDTKVDANDDSGDNTKDDAKTIKSQDTIITHLIPTNEKTGNSSIYNPDDDATNRFIESSDPISIKSIKINRKPKQKSKPNPPKKGKRLILSINR